MVGEEVARCDDCRQAIMPVATRVKRRGPTSKRYSAGTSAETVINLKLACDCKVYDTKMGECLGAVKASGHLPDAWSTDEVEKDGTEYSTVEQ